MGYRSDVAMVFYTRNKEALPTSVIKLWFDESYPVKEAKEEWDAKITYGEDYVRVEYEGVKWYTGYLHVEDARTACDSFVGAFSAEEEDTHAAFECARVGEEPGDVDESGSTYNDGRLWVRREIVFE